MEEKLEQYRLRKRRKQNWESFKDRVKQFLMPDRSETAIDIDQSNEINEQKLLEKPLKKSSLNEHEPLIAQEDEDEIDGAPTTTTAPNEESKLYKYTLRTVFFLFWVTLYIIAIELQFGIVFLMISALIGICLNTRTGPKKAGEISAYSVFNKDCEAIDGTLKAEQFEKELFYRGK